MKCSCILAAFVLVTLVGGHYAAPAAESLEDQLLEEIQLLQRKLSEETDEAKRAETDEPDLHESLKSGIDQEKRAETLDEPELQESLRSDIDQEEPAETLHAPELQRSLRNVSSALDEKRKLMILQLEVATLGGRCETYYHKGTTLTILSHVCRRLVAAMTKYNAATEKEKEQIDKHLLDNVDHALIAMSCSNYLVTKEQLVVKGFTIHTSIVLKTTQGLGFECVARFATVPKVGEAAEKDYEDAVESITSRSLENMITAARSAFHLYGRQ